MDILINRLNILGRKIQRKYPYINHGGCAIYATAIAEELENLNLHPRILVVSPEHAPYPPEDLEDIRDVAATVNDKTDVEEWNDKGIIFRHLIISFRFEGQEYHYDTGGVVEASDEYRDKDVDSKFALYNGHLLLKHAKQIIQKQAGWNRSFNRRDIPAIQQEVKEYMEPKHWATRKWLAKQGLGHTL